MGKKIRIRIRGLPGPPTEGQLCDLYAVLRTLLRIRIRRICMFYGLLDPDPDLLVSQMLPRYLDTFAASYILLLLQQSELLWLSALGIRCLFDPWIQDG
jgi:hypothetical protein